MAKRSIATPDMFDAPAELPRAPGSLSCRIQIANTMSEALSGLDRYDVSATMSRLLDRDISKHMLDAYTAESREDHIPPLDTAIAFDVATEGYSLLYLYASKVGAKVAFGQDALAVELGQLERKRDEYTKKIQRLKQAMEGK